jgi:hypothetical protein
MAVLLWAAWGCGSSDVQAPAATAPVATALPDVATGTYNVALSGGWTGTCVVGLAPSDALLSSLLATREGWKANLPGPYHAKSITRDGSSYRIKWDETVLTDGTPVRQQMEMVVAETAFSSSGFQGQYVHESDLTGIHSGDMSATRK